MTSWIYSSAPYEKETLALTTYTYEAKRGAKVT